jgi:chromosome segregation ATPase
MTLTEREWASAESKLERLKELEKRVHKIEAERDKFKALNSRFIEQLVDAHNRIAELERKAPW